MEKLVVSARSSVEDQLQADPVWLRAKTAYEAQRSKLKGKKVPEITSSDNPQELAALIQRIEAEKGTYVEAVNWTSKCVGFLTQRESAIDMLAQAGGSSGCLVWGCIKITLYMVRSYTAEYQKLLGVLSNICEWLQPVKLDVETFKDAENVQTYQLNLYILILKFWEKGISAYSHSHKKRNKIFHISRVL